MKRMIALLLLFILLFIPQRTCADGQAEEDPYTETVDTEFSEQIETESPQTEISSEAETAKEKDPADKSVSKTETSNSGNSSVQTIVGVPIEQPGTSSETESTGNMESDSTEKTELNSGTESFKETESNSGNEEASEPETKTKESESSPDNTGIGKILQISRNDWINTAFTSMISGVLTTVVYFAVRRQLRIS